MFRQGELIRKVRGGSNIGVRAVVVRVLENATLWNNDDMLVRLLDTATTITSTGVKFRRTPGALVGVKSAEWVLATDCYRVVAWDPQHDVWVPEHLRQQEK